MKKRLVSLLLAVCLMVGLCIPAWATSNITSTTGTYNAASSGFVEAVLTGTFSYTQIKVSVPTSIYFSLDPTKPVTSTTPRAQVSGGNFTVSNYSNTAIYLYITDMTYDSSKVQLTYSASNINDSSKYMMLSMYSSVDAVPDLTKDLSSTYNVVICNSDKYRFPVTKTAIPAGSLSTPVERECYVAARTGLGFNTGDSFEIKLTFVVDTSSKWDFFGKDTTIE